MPLARMADQRQRLHRLSQAHVVGEDPAQAVVVQRCQPGEPVVLVRAKLGVQRAWHGNRVEGLQRPQAHHLTLPFLGLTHHSGQ